MAHLLSAVLQARPRWQTFCALGVGLLATRATRTRWLQILILLLSLNWRNFPLVWHARCFLWVPYYRLQLRAITLGLIKPPKEARGKVLGLDGLETGLCGIGRSPFDIVHRTDEFVDFGSADYNGHLSNSSYNSLLDFNRFRWAIKACGPAFAREHLRVMLAETRCMFLREIPLLSSFQLEIRVAAWDQRFIYFYGRFLIPITRSLRNNPSAVKTHDSQSRECVLACISVSRMCAKLPRHKKMIPPGRIFIMGGLGVDAQNWDFAKELRRRKEAKHWLIDDSGDKTPAGMLPFEEKRSTAIELVYRLSDKASWLALDRFLCGA